MYSSTLKRVNVQRNKAIKSGMNESYRAMADNYISKAKHFNESSKKGKDPVLNSRLRQRALNCLLVALDLYSAHKGSYLYIEQQQNTKV